MSPRTVSNMIQVGSSVVDRTKIVGIERGAWDSSEQDWKAILVLHGNTRMETDVFIKTVVAALATYEDP